MPGEPPQPVRRHRGREVRRSGAVDNTHAVSLSAAVHLEDARPPPPPTAKPPPRRIQEARSYDDNPYAPDRELFEASVRREVRGANAAAIVSFAGRT